MVTLIPMADLFDRQGLGKFRVTDNFLTTAWRVLQSHTYKRLGPDLFMSHQPIGRAIQPYQKTNHTPREKKPPMMPPNKIAVGKDLDFSASVLFGITYQMRPTIAPQNPQHRIPSSSKSTRISSSQHRYSQITLRQISKPTKKQPSFYLTFNLLRNIVCSLLLV